MATLILTAVCTAIGGPIGGAIGAILGQRADQALLAPKARKGPRLEDLRVQTSSYGSQLPKLFGTTRVAGTVIWATDLKETRNRVSNGKGRPKTDTYSYSASFAVALSARRIMEVARIWADGNLLRGGAGDLKFEAVWRFYKGDEDQAVDPLIASAEGIGATPAYRGLAYAVFENLELGPFGNRIPSLSFEVIADEAPVTAGTVLVELSGGAVTSDGGSLLGGFAATGDSVRGVADSIAAALPFSLAVADGRPVARFGAGPSKAIDVDDPGATADDKRAARFAFDRASPDTLPELLTLAYADATRDYQPGQQCARRGAGGRREARVELAAVLAAEDAKAIAEARLGRFWAERTRATLTLPWRALDVAPGNVVHVPGTQGGWRVTETALEHMVARLTLVPEGIGAVTAVSADAGRILTQADLPSGETVVVVVDLPQSGDAPVNEPILAVAANGTSGGWRRAALLASADGGATYDALGGTAAPATIGTATTVLAPRGCDLIDGISAVEVTLANSGLSLHDADEAAMVAGANLALLGGELIQFQRAEPLGGNRWRLLRLWRGRRGTEAETGGHAVGEFFVLIEDATLFRVPGARVVPNLRVMAVGVGDADGVIATGPAAPGRALLPLSPVALTGTGSGGDTLIGWTRRSRDGWRWRDDVDAPVAEEREAYRVTRTAGDTSIDEEVAATAWTYTAAMRAADIASGATSAAIAIRQIGSFGLSPAASIILTL